VFAEIETEMRKQHGMIDNGFYAHSFRSASYHLLQEAGCTVLLHCVVADAAMKNGTMESVTVFAAGAEILIKGKVFIDASGDAQLLFLGDLPWVKGDEKSGLLQALTLFFRMGNIDLDKVAAYAAHNKADFFEWMDFTFDPTRIMSVAGYFAAVNKAIREHRLAPDVQYIFFTTLPGSGEGSFNTSNILNLDGSSSQDLTRAELAGRNQVHQIVTLLKNEIPGFEDSYLIETAPQVGVRETRRAVGEYVVTGEDITHGAKFDDAIARGCYGIDIHGQKGESSIMEHLAEGMYYEIPMRALLVKNSDNVLAAGRCISSTREGHSALRIQPTSSATGEACGALAAAAVASGRSVRDVDYGEVQDRVRYNISKR
jgi:FAD dependent oxidoreductase